MRKRVGKQVFGTKLVANRAIGNVLSPLAALLEPSVGANAQSRDSSLHLRSRPPALKRDAIEGEKKSFAKLFNRRQPCLLDPIKSTPGVGEATLWGPQDYAMRVWVHTDRLTVRV